MDVFIGGGIPVVNVDSNNDDGVGSSGDDDDDNHRNYNNKTAPCQCLLLEFLPRELLTQSILGGRYLNGNDLSNFWCAATAMSTKTIIRSSTIEDIIRIIRHRRTLLTSEEQTTLLTMEERNSNEEQDNDQDNEDDNVNNCDYARRLVFRAFEEAITAINDDDGDDDDDDDDHDHDHDKNEIISSFSFLNFLRLSRQIFGNLSAIDYCENVPSNLIWCGILQFRSKGYGNKEGKIQVVLVTHPRRWSVEQTRLWRNATTTMTTTTTTSSSKTTMMHNNETTAAAITVDVIPYNFVPVGPRRGRLVGVTKSDRRSLRQLSQRLDETELVGRFACTNSGRRSAHNHDDSRGGFNVKLISFAQGQRKLDHTFRQGREPGGIPLNEEKIRMTLRQKSKTHHHTENTLLQDDDDDDDPNDATDDATDNDRNSLLCCWDHDISWDEEENSRSIRIAETPLALRDTMREYNKLCTL